MLKKRAPVDEASLRRIIISVSILAVFWALVFYNYWPDLVPAVLKLVDSSRGIGATPVASRYFDVRNNSSASEAQVQMVVNDLEKQYDLITAYTGVKPAERLPVLVINGSGPTMIDGTQLVVYDDKGVMDLDLTPFFLVLMSEDIHIQPTSGLVPAGGHALQVIEAVGLGDHLTRQPLDSWVVLFQQSNAYIPLEEAWKITMPNDDDSLATLIRGVLESGSFMRWLTAKYGLESAMRMAHGASVDSATGKSLAENETEWLKALDNQKISPKSCDVVIPKRSMFNILCKKPPK